MSTQDIQQAIEQRLAQSTKRIVNRNAINALFGAFSDPVGALGKIFLGRTDALDAERGRLLQDATIELLCKIDAAISDLARTADAQGVTVDGLIETNAHRVDAVVGVEIDQDAGSVVFQPGTHIRTTATSVGRVTGLKIGGKSNTDR
jgi:hypothetical protein